MEKTQSGLAGGGDANEACFTCPLRGIAVRSGGERLVDLEIDRDVQKLDVAVAEDEIHRVSGVLAGKGHVVVVVDHRKEPAAQGVLRVARDVSGGGASHGVGRHRAAAQVPRVAAAGVRVPVDPHGPFVRAFADRHGIRRPVRDIANSDEAVGKKDAVAVDVAAVVPRGTRFSAGDAEILFSNRRERGRTPFHGAGAVVDRNRDFPKVPLGIPPDPSAIARVTRFVQFVNPGKLDIRENDRQEPGTAAIASLAIHGNAHDRPGR